VIPEPGTAVISVQSPVFVSKPWNARFWANAAADSSTSEATSAECFIYPHLRDGGEVYNFAPDNTIVSMDRRINNEK
jgi:hypothetical protein